MVVGAARSPCFPQRSGLWVVPAPSLSAAPSGPPCRSYALLPTGAQTEALSDQGPADKAWTHAFRCQDGLGLAWRLPRPGGKLCAEPGQRTEETASTTTQGGPRDKAQAPESRAPRAAEHTDRHLRASPGESKSRWLSRNSSFLKHLSQRHNARQTHSCGAARRQQVSAGPWVEPGSHPGRSLGA